MMFRGVVLIMAVTVLLSIGSCTGLAITGFCFDEGRYLARDERIRRAVVSYLDPLESPENAAEIDRFIKDGCCRYSGGPAGTLAAYQVDLYLLEDEDPNAKYRYRGAYLMMSACGKIIDSTGEELSEEAVERALAAS